MGIGWTFRRMDRGEMNIDPIQSEFFTTEAIDGQAEAIVRESIQNSLDAAIPGKKAKVRFRMSNDGEALERDSHSFFLRGLDPHLSAPEVGLTKRPDDGEPVSFLSIEDFETRGLSGDPAQAEDRLGSDNDFFYFWRNIGRSRKGKRTAGGGDSGRTFSRQPAGSTLFWASHVAGTMASFS